MVAKPVGTASFPRADQSFGLPAGFQQSPLWSDQGKQVADRIRAMPNAIHSDCKSVAPVDGQVIPALRRG